ncbi:TetR/AcrR family transcriptional regulator [Leisingera sp. ANG-Vp]|uniref:TetR/AcrR family transcriptional regulator n=1 Tax=Leisingera sp. ANG-Vp TaxID=1577896 RepID=UPI00057FA8DC|nr:TetR/AcrR family transcriptional regulator [Leisingera sp. ANG-Vp]KIC21575.1 TetR family transcriptional regulator [Leisingera sp. ANG-Vp]
MDDVTTAGSAPDQPLPTRERLILAAASLFRNKGYSGTGLAELLTEAAAPKGSLYHHFPNGKSDLALAAANWASEQMLQLIDASFTPAPSFQEGAKTVCYKLAKLFDLQGKWSGCPVSATLFEGPENEAFHQHAALLFEGWISATAAHAQRLGLAEAEAQAAAENFYILLQGGWQLARVRRDSDVIRGLHLQLCPPMQLQKND